MAITDGTAGEWVATTTRNPTVTLPSHTTGQMLLIRMGWKSATPTTDVALCSTSGWAKIGQYYNGGGASSNGGGGVLVAVFWKVATSDAETDPTIEFDDATAPTPGAYCAVNYSKGSSQVWLTPLGDGGPIAAATSYTGTIQSHVSATSGDMLDSFAVICDNNAMTVPTVAQTGLTLDSVTEYPATALSSATSNDIAADGCNRLATAGTSSAAAVVSGSQAASDAGAAWVTRLRVEDITTIAPSAISSAEAFGSVTLLPGNINLVPTAIPEPTSGITPTVAFTCGAECAALAHWTSKTATATRDTGTKRSGAASIKIAAAGAAAYTNWAVTTVNPWIARFSVYLDGLPGADAQLTLLVRATTGDVGLVYDVASGKLGIHEENGTTVLGSVIANQTWTTIDMKVDGTAQTVEWKVNGSAQTTVNLTYTGTWHTWYCGQNATYGGFPALTTYTAYFDDVVISNTAGDYPISDGYASGDPEDWVLNTVISSPIVTGNNTLVPTAINAPGGDYSSVILADSPTGYWRLGEPSGTTAEDETANNYDLTYTGTPTLGVTGLLTGDSDTAVTFVGSTEYATRASGVSLSAPYSVEFWAKGDTSQNYFGVRIGTGTPMFMAGRPSAGRPITYLSTTNYRYWSTTAHTDGERHHYVFVVTGDGINDIDNSKLYIDGTSISAYSTTKTGDPLTPTGLVTVGWYTTDSNTVTADEVAVYDFALTLAQAQAHYDAGINGIAAFGTPTITQTQPSVAPSSIDSSEIIGTAIILAGGVSTQPSAISSAEVLGGATLLKSSSISPSGIATAETLPSVILLYGGVSILPSGLPSTENHGTATILKGGVGVSPSGITSLESINNPILISSAIVQPGAIASAEAVPSVVIAVGGVSISPTGIASSETFGTATIATGGVNLLPTAITSAEAFGTAQLISIVGAIIPSSIDSGEALGTATIFVGGVEVEASSVNSAEAFGQAVIRNNNAVLVTGVATGEFVSVPLISLGTARITVNGIVSAEVFGTPILPAGISLISPSGISGLETFGTGTLLYGGVKIIPTGIITEQAFGTTVLYKQKTLISTGVSSLEAFGTPTLVKGSVYFQVTGIISFEQFGQSFLSMGGMLISTNGITTGQVLGSPLLTTFSTIIPEGTASAETLGWPILIPGMVYISPESTVPVEIFGVPRLVGSLVSWRWVNRQPEWVLTKKGGFPSMQDGHATTTRDEGED